MPTPSPAARLRTLLAVPGLVAAPGCFDALSAALIQQAGFPAAFLGGFSVAASRLFLPDTGLLTTTETADQARDVCAAVSIPVIGDGDTGGGDPANVVRTVHTFARAGLACLMIEDQETPKRCGHTAGKQVVSRGQAVGRIRAAVQARDAGSDILILARTDALAVHGLDHALDRAKAFADEGADLTFVEAPRTRKEMARIARETPGPAMVSLVENGLTPWCSRTELEEMGFALAVYPVSLLLDVTGAMRACLDTLAEDLPREPLTGFAAMRDLLGYGART